MLRSSVAGNAIGPTFGREEFAGRKLSALFDRTEARDFADVFVLTKHFDKDDLLSFARQVDAGIPSPELAEMMRSVRRFDDHAFPITPNDVPRLREFFLEWADELDAGPGS